MKRGRRCPPYFPEHECGTSQKIFSTNPYQISTGKYRRRGSSFVDNGRLVFDNDVKNVYLMSRNDHIRGPIIAIMVVVVLFLGGSPALGEKKYFPEKVLSDKGNLVIFNGKDYAGALQKMGESPLYGVPQTRDTEVYRIVWTGNDRYTRGFRLARSGDTYRFRYIVLGGVDSFVDHDETILLSSAEWNQLTSGLEGIDFCTLPATNKGFILHGNSWLFEIAKPGGYCVLTRNDKGVNDDESRRLHTLFKLLFKRAMQEIENR